MEKEKLINEIKDRLKMIWNNYGCLDHYAVELIEDTLKECLKYLLRSKYERERTRNN